MLRRKRKKNNERWKEINAIALGISHGSLGQTEEVNGLYLTELNAGTETDRTSNKQFQLQGIYLPGTS